MEMDEVIQDLGLSFEGFLVVYFQKEKEEVKEDRDRENVIRR